MPEQETTDVLDAIAARLSLVEAFAGRVDAFVPVTLKTYPRIVLRYLDSPWKLSPMRNQIVHVIQIEIIIAPIADVQKARRAAASYIRDVKSALFARAGGVQLIAQPHQTTVGAEGSQWLRNVIYNDEQYLAAGIIIRAIEVTGETFTNG
jgi:hypothetical protein